MIPPFKGPLLMFSMEKAGGSGWPPLGKPARMVAIEKHGEKS
jgi:hypothetical protein